MPRIWRLPQYPGMRGYAALDGGLRAAGFRHAAEVLRPPEPSAAASIFATLRDTGRESGFRVLDGLWFPARGTRWRRVDLAYVRECRARWESGDDPRADAAVPLLDTLETLHRDDPANLRRIVLWQLCCQLRDAGTPVTGAAAEALGVHADEAQELADAVTADFPAAGPGREAAEEISEVWPGTRVRHAVLLAKLLPARPDDHVLARLLTGLRERHTAVRGLKDEAAERERRGETRAAADTWLDALRQATDDRDARAGLFRTAALLADDPLLAPEETVTAAVTGHTAQLSWRPARRHPAEVGYRLFRFPERAPDRAVELTVPEDGPCAAVDTGLPLGVPLRYVVLPTRGGRPAGVPRASGTVLLTPEVEGLCAQTVLDGVRLRWLTDDAARAVKAVRTDRTTGPPGTGTPLPCDLTGLLDTALPPGDYRYLVSCGYPGPGPDGELVWSPGRTVTARAEVWPSPVTELRAGPPDGEGRVHVTWPSPDRGRTRLVRWRTPPVGPGEDVSALLARTPEGDADAGSVEMPPPGTMARVTAVSTLDGRTVSGPSLVLEHPGPVTGLVARRLETDRAEVLFDWPEPSVLVALRWECGALREERRVPRSRHLAEGRVEIPVFWPECRITVTPLTRPDAIGVPGTGAAAVLPAVPPPPTTTGRPSWVPWTPASGPGRWRPRNALLARILRWRPWPRRR
ncbi:hypothetical protein [Streptomyces sp. NPDC048172]|uniref:hypothetical protein n=1 Tax=Streptomyces sp. NPDC048172 TaxID=3365505 RepID=UPI00371CD4D6